MLVEGLAGDRDATIHRCDGCSRAFRRFAHLHDHIKVFAGSNEGRIQHSTIHRVAEIASKLVYQGSVEHDIIYNPRGRCNYLDDIDVNAVRDGTILEQGWAERRPEGDTVGTNYEPRYRQLINKWFEMG